ncbi:hypothetical protein BG07_5574 (plasmid) [Bacillus pseudomycoides]|nr:hypothetical protein DJ92_5400 [Bacillus pseudomycoides]AJI14770.1 hypothetical protein BG07_5574 [Bacillus pseudomycoides]
MSKELADELYEKNIYKLLKLFFFLNAIGLQRGKTS